MVLVMVFGGAKMVFFTSLTDYAVYLSFLPLVCLSNQDSSKNGGLNFRWITDRTETK